MAAVPIVLIVVISGLVLLSSSKGMHVVTFQQLIGGGACSSTLWTIPWSVTIGNTTKVQPSNTTTPFLPLNNFTFLYGTTNRNFSEITFLLPDGMYQFKVSPSSGFFSPTFGTVNVARSDITVPIASANTGTSCTTITVSQRAQNEASRVNMIGFMSIA